MNIIGKTIIALKLCACYAYDWSRFLRHAHLFDDAFRTKESARANLLRHSHSLEKGLAMPVPKPGFGKQLADTVMADLERYHSLYSPDYITYAVGGIMWEVIQHHQKQEIYWHDLVKRLEQLPNQLDSFAKTSGEIKVGLIDVTKNLILNKAPDDPEGFFNSRHSVRQFSAEKLSRDEIQKALKLAQRCPSVCNRQGARVHIYDDCELREKILSHQDGNRGFGDTASVVFAITVDLSVFYKNGERNQAYVDGGIFAMNLTLALHSLGFGSCLLNWAMSPRQDIAIRKSMKIPDNEVIITLMAAGKLNDKFSVAASPRRPLCDIAAWNC